MGCNTEETAYRESLRSRKPAALTHGPVLKTNTARRKVTNIAVALVTCLVLTAGTAWAASFNAELVGSFPVYITQGQTVNQAFAVRLTANGTFPSTQSGKIIVCNAVTLNADGTATCTSNAEINIQNGNHKTLGQFPQDVQVSVTVASDVACNQTYSMSVRVELDVTGGADFGSGGIRELELPFDVQVSCANAEFQGCSQGFWKNHMTEWPSIGYNYVGQLFSSADKSVYGLGGYTLLDFNHLRRTGQEEAVPIAASIFLDVLNIFLFFLQLFGGDNE
jgi:hypothetical protein